MTKKLVGNGLWESSRMMLPQHKERINLANKELNKKTKPTLHEDEWEIIIQNIGLSLEYNEPVTVTIFGDYENTIISGIVTHVDQWGKKFKVESGEGFDWIDFNELISVTMK